MKTSSSPFLPNSLPGCLKACLMLLCLYSPLLVAASTAGIKVKTQTYASLARQVEHKVGAFVPATSDSAISAQISAIIQQFHVDVGEQVKQGALLVTLDCATYRLRLQQARAQLDAEKARLDNAGKQLKQAESLKKQGNLSKEIYNQRVANEASARATVTAQRIAVKIAARDVEHCKISAPFDGYITQRYTGIGELTQPGVALLQMVSRDNPLVEAQISERQLAGFIDGDNHHYRYRQNDYPLSIEQVLPILDTQTHTHRVRLRFTDKRAVTGSVGDLVWRDKAYSLPASLLLRRNNRAGIFLARKNRAVFYPVDNAVEGQPLLVKLDNNESLITVGRFSLNDGDPVQIETDSAPADRGE